MEIDLGDKKGLYKSDMMMYEMLARNDWKRPFYMSVTLGQGNMAGLENYLVLEGLAYRLTPFKVGFGTIDVDKMYNNLMNRFKYGNVAAEGIYLDETVRRMCNTHRHMFTQLAVALLEKGDKERALKVMQKCKEVLPQSNVPYELADYGLIQLWSDLGQVDEASRIAMDIARQSKQYFTWADDLTSGHMANKSASVNREYRQHLACLRDIKEMTESNGKNGEGKITLNDAAMKEINAVLHAVYNSPQMKGTYENILNSHESNWAQIQAAVNSFRTKEPTPEELEAIVYAFTELYEQVAEIAADPGIQQMGLNARAENLKKQLEDSPFGQEMQKARQQNAKATTDSLSKK
jgi:tetratricopeptide (TPR) repeat protein